MVMVITNAALFDKKSKLSLPGSHMSLCLRYTWYIYACKQICGAIASYIFKTPQRDQVQLSSYTATGITYKYSGPSDSQHNVARHGVTESDRN